MSTDLLIIEFIAFLYFGSFLGIFLLLFGFVCRGFRVEESARRVYLYALNSREAMKSDVWQGQTGNTGHRRVEIPYGSAQDLC